MRKILFVFGVMLVACSQAPKDKAIALIKEDVKKSLYHPESYEAVETLFDSAFAPKDDPAFFEKTLKFSRLAIEIQNVTEKGRMAERRMNTWCQAYMSGIDQVNYIQAKQEYDEAIQKVEKLNFRLQKVSEELRKLAVPYRCFIGFKLTHTFRTKNNEGNTQMGKKIYSMW